MFCEPDDTYHGLVHTSRFGRTFVAGGIFRLPGQDGGRGATNTARFLVCTEF